MDILDKRYDTVRLVFHEEEHKYNDNLGNDYLSTTTLIHNYKPKFDKSYWLKKKAKELNMSEKDLEKQWKDITDEACARGTNTHNGLEDGIKGSSKFKQAIEYLDRKNDGVMITVADIPSFNAEYKLLNIKDFIELTDNKYPEIYKAFEFYVSKGYKIYAEIGMFLIDWLVSGTIDVLLIRDDSFVIGDWKTNRGGLIFSSGYYRKDKTQKPAQLTNEWVYKKEYLLPPVNHMEHCNGNLYNLQLSMYAFAVEHILNIPCKGLWLCHIDSDFVLNEYNMPKRFSDGLYHIKDNPVERTRFFVMPYRKFEIISILIDRKLQVKANKVNNQFKLSI